MLGSPASDANAANMLAGSLAFAALIYYFMMVHRTIKLIDAQPGWSARYTPAAAVVKHFIPLYGLFFLYRWPADADNYVRWRLGRKSRAGLWTSLGLFAGIVLRFVDVYLGLLATTASLYFLYVPLRRALGDIPQQEVAAPASNGMLGLR